MKTITLKNIIASLVLTAGTALTAAPKPNVILIMADDLGYANLSSYGAERINTPHIDALGASGVKFTDFHSNGAICSPTRAALLTGRYQQRVGWGIDFGSIAAVRDRKAQMNGLKLDRGLVAEEFTIAEAMKAAGYRTAVFGKWHLGYGAIHNPVNQGFDQFRGYISGNVDLVSHIDEVGNHDWWDAAELKADEGYLTTLITDYTIDFIAENKEQPFFIYLSHIAPHYPLQGPNDPAFRKVGVKRNVKQELPSDDRLLIVEKEMIESLDNEVGRLIEYLDDNDLRENTLIIFCSDNGSTSRLSAKNLTRLGAQSSNGDWRGEKTTFYEGGHRVPGMISMPGTIPAEQVSDATVMTMDLYPTILGLTGSAEVLPEDLVIDGVDLSPLVQSGTALEPRTLFWGRYDKPSKAFRGVRQSDWMLVNNELYDLAEDPTQKSDLAKTHPEKFQQLRALWNDWVLEVVPSKEKQAEYLTHEVTAVSRNKKSKK